MSGQEPNETQELEQKDAPPTVTTVSTAVKRKRTRRPKLIWVLGEKMRADDPRRHLDFGYDSEEATDDYVDWEPAELEFHAIFCSIYDLTHTFFGGAFGRALATKILPYLVCDCRGRLSCRQMEIHTPPFDETQIFNGMLLNRVRAIPGYVDFSEDVYDTFDDYDHNHFRSDHGKPMDLLFKENGEQYWASASDDSAFSDDEY
jgi:hypothetical protein